MDPLVALVLALGSPAPDVAERIGLDWQAPAGCPTHTEVRAAIGGYLGRERFGDAVDDVVARGVVRRDRRGQRMWRLAITVQLPTGIVEREVEAARCEELRDAAGLIIAVALDPLRVSQRVQPEPEPAAPPQPVEPTPVAVTPAPAVPRQSFVDLRLGGGVEVGTIPGAAAALRLGVALARRRLRVELAGRYVLPRTVRPFNSPADAGVTLQAGTVAARACFVPHVRRVEFPSCAQVEAGAMRGTGTGLDAPRTSHRAWVTAAIGQEVAWHSRRRIGLFVAADAALSILRPRFVVDDLGTVFEAGWAAFRAVAGPSLRL